jgi:two-component system cell cycle response regulator CtrA
MDEPEVKIIDVFICKLRKKIEKISPDGGHCIETVWGRGYVLRDPNGGAAAGTTTKESANA